MIDQDAIRARYNALGPFLNERDRRLFAASEARAAGHGGIAAVSRTTGIARSTIGRGLADLRSGAVRCGERVRRRGGGQKPAIETQPGILEALNELAEPSIASSARRCLTASTTFPPMPDSSMSASALTPESSLSRAFDTGGTKSAPRVIRMPGRC